MTGLELSRLYYEQAGRDALTQAFPSLFPRMAIGLAGEGSECLGFDDSLSRDHDWGPGFCIWLREDDYQRFGQDVQALYNQLPGAFAGFPRREDHPHSGKRVGCFSAPAWYRRYTGFPEGPQTLSQWRHIPEAFLATAVNGQVFQDPDGRFSAVRARLLEFYPEDLRIKKIACRGAIMAQAGQYNYPRCAKRGDTVAAQLALAEFTRSALFMVYLLNRRYAPFYKWMHRGIQELPKLRRVGVQLEALSQERDPLRATELIEGICLNTAAEWARQGLSSLNSPFLLDHCEGMMALIRDPELRSAHIMEE